MTLYTQAERAQLAKAAAIKSAKRKEAKRARPVSPKKDRGRVRNNGYLAWLRRQPCCIATDRCDGPTEAAHIRTHKPGELPTGMQRKPDDERATPLCRFHHTSQHRVNEWAWWKARDLDPFEVAARHYAAYQEMK